MANLLWNNVLHIWRILNQTGNEKSIGNVEVAGTESPGGLSSKI